VYLWGGHIPLLLSRSPHFACICCSTSFLTLSLLYFIHLGDRTFCLARPWHSHLSPNLSIIVQWPAISIVVFVFLYHPRNSINLGLEIALMTPRSFPSFPSCCSRTFTLAGFSTLWRDEIESSLSLYTSFHIPDDPKSKDYIPPVMQKSNTSHLSLTCCMCIAIEKANGLSISTSLQLATFSRILSSIPGSGFRSVFHSSWSLN